MYEAKKLAEQERFGDVERREDHRAEVFRIAKQITSTNRDVVGDKCVTDDSGALATRQAQRQAQCLARALPAFVE